MLTACLTGGIATGKSLVTRLIAEERPDVAVFDCDASVHQIMAEEGWISRLAREFGEQIRGADGRIDRPTLRAVVFAAPDRRERLEAMLHPEVRRRCRLAQEAAASSRAVRLFLAEVPLLYESQFDLPRDCEIVVASSPASQRGRLRSDRGLDDQTAERILAAQWPIMEKVRRSPIVIWNGGSIPCLKRQVLCLRRRLKLPEQAN